MSEHIVKSHNITLLLYHLVCPIKYRRKVLTSIVADTLVKTCLEISKRYEIHFVEIGADEDHAHFLLQSVPTFLPSRFVQTIKSITAKEIFKLQPEVKRFLWGGQFWTDGYYLATVGKHGNEKVISEYVKKQNRTYQRFYRGQLTLFEGLA